MTKKRHHGPKKADDFLEELAQDEEYQAMLREKEAKWAALDAELTKDEVSLVQELQEAGVYIVEDSLPWERYEGPPRSIWDLVNTKSRYPQAIPILVKHLRIEHHQRTKEGIVRALTVPEARGIAFEPLVDEFRRIDDPDSGYKWVVGMAIAQTATPQTVPTVFELIRDQRHGKARDELPLALLCFPMDEAEALLEPMTEDPDLAKCATEALKRIRRRKRRSP